MTILCNLPDSITLPDGTELSHRTAIYKGKRPNGDELQLKGVRYRKIGVLHRNLRGKNDLRGHPYEPTEWIFTDKKI